MRTQWAVLPLRLVVGYGFLAHGPVKWSRGPAGFAKLLHQIGVPLYIAALIALALAGPGPWSVDGWRSRRRELPAS
jgi:uncharacterized membrane protein YphA (DoxX/SURF4 family)